MIRAPHHHYVKDPVYFSKIPSMSNFSFPQPQHYQTIFTNIIRESSVYSTRNLDKIEPTDEHEFDFRGVTEVMLQQSIPPVIIPYIPRVHLK